MSDSTIVLVTGIARGIGKGLVQAYLSRPNHIVIGSVRDTTAPYVQELQDLPTAPGCRLLLIQIENTTPTDFPKAIADIEAAGIEHLDIVIANAGICPAPAPVSTVDINDVTTAFDVNALGTLRLYQAVRHLLEKSSKPKWVSIGTGAASFAFVETHNTWFFAAYAISKAAMHWFTLAAHGSEKWLTAFAIHPGLVQTEMGNAGAKLSGMEKAPTTIGEAVTKTIATIDGATREAASGKFLNVIDGVEVPW